MLVRKLDIDVAGEQADWWKDKTQDAVLYEEEEEEEEEVEDK